MVNAIFLAENKNWITVFIYLTVSIENRDQFMIERILLRLEIINVG